MSNTEQRGNVGAIGRRVPLAVKLLYTAFVAVMVPYYLRCYGPTNFLYYCGVAVLGDEKGGDEKGISESAG